MIQISFNSIFHFSNSYLIMKAEENHQELPLLQDKQQEEVPIFDEDDWIDENNVAASEKSIPETEVSKKELEIIEEININIKSTREGFMKAGKLPSIEGTNKENIKNKLFNPANILKEGYLEKQTDGFFFKYTTRYVVLTPEKLIWFEDQKKVRAIGCVNLRLLKADLRDSEEGEFVLDFHGECECLIFKPKEKVEWKQWKQLLETVISYQKQADKLMLQTTEKLTYQFKDVLTEKEFLSEAETGDILLFYTEHYGAKIQRFFTGGDYDHVAMIVNLKGKELMVFESNEMYGVSIFGWKEYVSFFNLYGKIALRKLNYIRKAQAQNSILKFIKKNLGKKYEISAYKLLKFQSDFDWTTVNEERGYFCSELVGKVLKSIGLLDEKKSSGRYWPADFAETGDLRLLRGASLGSEQTVILNKHTKNKGK